MTDYLVGRQTDAEVAAIAAGLTKAQRDAFTRVGFNPLDDLALDRPGIARQLHDKGLTFIDWSPLGLRVAQHLKQENSHG